MSDNIYPKGLFIKQPHENAPDFVKGEVSIKIQDFINFLKENENSDGWCNFQLLRGERGLYMKLNTWRPESAKQGGAKQATGVEEDDDLPF